MVAVRQPRNSAKPAPRTTVTFSSRGIVTSANNSDFANKFVILDSPGNMFDPNVGDTCYTSVSIPINLRYYFATGLFERYEQYRVKAVETTFTWSAMPRSGPVCGMMLYACDKDSDGSIPSIDVVSRRDAAEKRFDNNNMSHTIHWKPWLVQYDDYTTSNQVPYVLPRDRWLNCQQAPTHRFGTLRAYFEASGKPNYTTDVDPVVRIRHRIVIECRGLVNATPDVTRVVEVPLEMEDDHVVETDQEERMQNLEQIRETA